MASKTEFNWALKLKPENGLDEKNITAGKSYGFSKSEYRIYPVDVPIDLINRNWEAIAKVVVTEFTCGDGKTKGIYKVFRLYTGHEKETLTNYFRENVKLMKGDITDFSNVKLS